MGGEGGAGGGPEGVGGRRPGGRGLRPGAAGHRESPMARPARLSRPLRSGHRPSPSPGPAVLEAGPRLWTDPLHWCLASRGVPTPEEPCESAKVTIVLGPIKTPSKGHEAQRQPRPRSGGCLPAGPGQVTETQSPFLQKKRVPCLRRGCPGDSSVSAQARGTQSFCLQWKHRLQMPSPARPSSRPGGRPDGSVTREPARPGSRKPRTQPPERERFRPRASTVPGRQCGAFGAHAIQP